MSDWDPQQYERFAEERSRPFHDLVALCRPVPGGRVMDLGCGTGALTMALPSALGGPAEVLGTDSSPAMLREAAQRAGGAVRFEQRDLRAVDGVWDLLLANASLQWVPDHAAVVAGWAQHLAPGGQLAFQVPANHDHASHLTLGEVAAEEPFLSLLPADAVIDPVAANVLDPARYAELLHDLGFAERTVRLEVYGPVLHRSTDVVAWMEGTSLTRIRRALPADDYTRFLDRYRDRLLDRIGDRSPYYFAFKRILVWGRLGS
jgi:trans-aconitate 2-methyltransferase